MEGHKLFLAQTKTKQVALYSNANTTSKHAQVERNCSHYMHNKQWKNHSRVQLMMKSPIVNH